MLLLKLLFLTNIVINAEDLKGTEKLEQIKLIEKVKKDTSMPGGAVINNKFKHRCFTKSGLLMIEMSENINAEKVCGDKGYLTDDPRQQVPNHKLIIYHKCFTESGLLMLESSTDTNGIRVCEQKGYLSSPPTVMDKCRIVNESIKTISYLGETLDYTEMEFECGNKIDLSGANRMKTTCKGKQMGKLRDCLSDRFNIDTWKQEKTKAQMIPKNKLIITNPKDKTAP